LLVVDDKVGGRKLVRAVLEGFGYTIPARSEIAIEASDGNNWLVVVLFSLGAFRKPAARNGVPDCNALRAHHALSSSSGLVHAV
jgi:hypothetical protein